MKVLIVDDHPLVAEALRPVLASIDPDAHLVCAASAIEGINAVYECPGLRLAIIDLVLPDACGMTLLSELRRDFSGLPVAVLSATSSRAAVASAINAGASGFITKTASMQLIGNALRCILDGQVYVPSETMLDRPSESRPADSSPASARERGYLLSVPQRFRAQAIGLSEREIDVLERLLAGESNKTIAGVLCIAESTVKAHLTAIFRIIKARSRTHVAVIVGQGFLDAW